MNLLLVPAQIAAIFFLTLACTPNSKAQRLSRDLHMGIITSHVGYLPDATKTCLAQGDQQRHFEVVEITSGKVVFKGTMVPHKGDFGQYAIADFSRLTTAGKYYLRADTIRSYPITISPSVYQPAITMIVDYFSKQRCGASTTGYLSPCHLDDGIRVDNGTHQDVTGGWHDASDLRKWVSATLYGMIGLAKAYEQQPAELKKKMLDELQWGNQYFLKMQEPEGYVMDFVGGDLKKHSDNNRWTDNKIEKGGTDIKLVRPNAGTSNVLMLVSGSYDDRVIQTQPVDMTAQYNFISAQSMVARLTANTDASYSKKCLNAAKKCYDWCVRSAKDTTAGILGSALQAAVELYRATHEQQYSKHASDLAQKLASLQAKANDADTSTPSGFYYASATMDEPFKNIWEGCQAFIVLADMVNLFPGHADIRIWKNMINSYADRYLVHLAGKNTFGIVPWGLYENTDPGGSRKAGKYWYRYFMQPEQEWWVGINSNIASAGIGLLKAAVVLKDDRFKALAQKQLDWILGSNPLNSSTLIGAGYNHPEHFAGSSFQPQVPVLQGAVMNGLGGDHNDMPVIGKGDWQISEYWTPMVAHTLWLMAELTGSAK